MWNVWRRLLNTGGKENAEGEEVLSPHVASPVRDACASLPQSRLPARLFQGAALCSCGLVAPGRVGCADGLKARASRWPTYAHNTFWRPQRLLSEKRTVFAAVRHASGPFGRGSTFGVQGGVLCCGSRRARISVRNKLQSKACCIRDRADTSQTYFVGDQSPTGPLRRNSGARPSVVFVWCL